MYEIKMDLRITGFTESEFETDSKAASCFSDVEPQRNENSMASLQRI
jgi:hypothetical protein